MFYQVKYGEAEHEGVKVPLNSDPPVEHADRSLDIRGIENVEHADRSLDIRGIEKVPQTLEGSLSKGGWAETLCLGGFLSGRLDFFLNGRKTR
jgi:hypothetical protein